MEGKLAVSQSDKVEPCLQIFQSVGSPIHALNKLKQKSECLPFSSLLKWHKVIAEGIHLNPRITKEFSLCWKQNCLWLNKSGHEQLLVSRVCNKNVISHRVLHAHIEKKGEQIIRKSKNKGWNETLDVFPFKALRFVGVQMSFHIYSKQIMKEVRGIKRQLLCSAKRFDEPQLNYPCLKTRKKE